MERTPIYLDFNATTPVLPLVLEAMLPFLREEFGNPSSRHVYGQRAHQAVERAREQVAALLGAEPEEILFTSGGTESNNLVLHGAIDPGGSRRRIVTSAVEHPAVAGPCDHLARQGWEVVRAGVDQAGQVRLEELEKLIDERTALVSIMLANNETGTVMPLGHVAGLARRAGCLVHTDAAQAVGKIAVRPGDMEIDYLSLAGHKVYAPKGVGALFVRRKAPLRPFFSGAGHEGGRRPGTENVAGIAGLGAACALAEAGLDAEGRRQQELRDRLWGLLRAGAPGLKLNGHPTERLPNTLNVSFPKVRGSALLEAVPGIAASTGSACHEGGERPSPVLMAMGLEAEIALGAVRLTLGRSTTATAIDTAARLMIEAWSRLVHRA